METNKQILQKTTKLINYWKAGKLGGEFMPKDKNSNYPLGNKENFLYLTLPMALNYRRNPYKL